MSFFPRLEKIATSTKRERKKKKLNLLNCDLADGLRERLRDRRQVLRDRVGQRDAVRVDQRADGELVHVLD